MRILRAKAVAVGFAVLMVMVAGCGGSSSITQVPETTASDTTSAEPGTTEAPTTAEEPDITVAGPFVLTSTAFDDGGGIPPRYTCVVDNVSPELAWSGVPAGTTSLALVLVDPDAQDFVHWVAWNLPPDSTGFAEDVPGDPALADGTLQAENDFAASVEPGELGPGGAAFRTIGYDGPCPPAVHTYVFTLYALTGTIDLPGGTPAADILAAIDAAEADGSLIGEATYSGLFGSE